MSSPMKGRAQSIGFGFARLLLVLSGMALAVFLIPLILEGWFLLTTPASSDHERRMTWVLLVMVLVFVLTGTLGFLLMRRWRPDSLRLKAVKSQRTMTGIRVFGYVSWAIIIGVECLMHLPGTWLERVGLTTLTFALLLAGVHICVATHELGHFLAAMCAGLEPLYFRIGRGPLLWRRVGSGGLLVEWRLLPSGGLVKAWRRDGRFSRSRHWLMIAAGPAASLALSVVLWRFFPSWPSLDHGAWAYTWERVGFALLVGNTFLLLNTVVPQRVLFDGQQFSSDGLHMLRLLRRPKESPAELTKAVHLQRIGFFWESRQHARAWAELREVEASLPEASVWLDLPRGLFTAEEGDWALSREALERWLAGAEHPAELRRPVLCQLALACAGMRELQAARAHCVALLRGAPRAERAKWLDHCASLPMISGQPELLSHARRWIKLALALDPANLVFQGTEAALQFEQGEAGAAEAVFRKLLSSKVDANNRGMAAFYLALALRRRAAPAGEVALWRRNALRWCDQLWLHRRAAVELPENDQAGNVTVEGELVGAVED
jgi:hypothetical protein